MKRFLCILAVLFASAFVFSQEIKYRCIEDTYGSMSEKIRKGTKGDGNQVLKGDIISLNLTKAPKIRTAISTFYGTCKNGEKYYYKLDDFEIVGSDKIPGVKYDKTSEVKIKSVEMIASYYFDILKKNDISAIYEYEPFWKDNEWIAPDEHFSDYYDADRYFIFSNTTIVDNKRDCRPDDQEPYVVGLSYWALIKEIKRINDNLYSVKVFCKEELFDSTTNFIDEFVDLYKNDENTFYLEYDGDYVKIALNEKSNVIGTYVIITSDIEEHINKQLNNIACGHKADLSNITWPRHADGSCDYDGSKKTAAVQTAKATPSTNVTPNKTMLVSENLKLRSGEATTSDVLTVMSAGTKVKILELGKAENIDGINSNWVKVEVQSGAKGRDGNTISRGTVGWCYGGYLAETTEANNFESTDTKEISDIKIEEAPKQEINIGIVCAIIGAVLLLLVLILIFAVRKKKDNP